MIHEHRVVPHPVGLNAEFYQWCARGELRFQRCERCAAWRHPPRFLCPACGAEEWVWAQASGRGRVFTWTVTHQLFDPAYADEMPYAVVVAQMDEGPRLVGNLRGIAPGALRLDLALEVLFEPLDGSVALTHFRPLASPEAAEPPIQDVR